MGMALGAHRYCRKARRERTTKTAIICHLEGNGTKGKRRFFTGICRTASGGSGAPNPHANGQRAGTGAVHPGLSAFPEYSGNGDGESTVAKENRRSEKASGRRTQREEQGFAAIGKGLVYASLQSGRKRTGVGRYSEVRRKDFPRSSRLRVLR